MNKLPAHLHTTQRKWKARKRQEYRALLEAFRTFQLGVAYTPIYRDFAAMQRQVDALAERISAKEWGR